MARAATETQADVVTLHAGGMRVLVFLLSLSLLVGCGSGSAAPETLRDVCFDIGSVFCQRGVECDIIAGSEQVTCENQFMQGCCLDDGTCSEPVRDDISGDEWEECLMALERESCPDIEAGNLPSRCLEI